MWQALIGPVAGLFTKALDIVDDLIPDKDLAAKLKVALQQRILEITSTEFLTLLQSQTKIILAEAGGNSLQRNWRPILMLVIVAIVANNYLLYPYLSLFWAKAPELVLPDHLYQLMKIGVGGYVVGRSAEKVAAVMKP
jgi:hypothetical protein